MNDISKIWYILNQAVSGMYPVYNLAIKLQGLDEKVIYNISNDISERIHTKKEIQKPTDTDFYEFYKSRIKQEKINKLLNKGGI